MTPEQEDWLRKRIVQLKSRANCTTTGPFRQAGIHRTISGMKAQLRDGVWEPHEPQMTTPDIAADTGREG